MALQAHSWTGHSREDSSCVTERLGGVWIIEISPGWHNTARAGGPKRVSNRNLALLSTVLAGASKANPDRIFAGISAGPKERFNHLSVQQRPKREQGSAKITQKNKIPHDT